MFGFDLRELITAAGYAGLFGIIFAESGLLFGFFLPGDSLLFTAGILASEGYLNIWALVLVCFVAAVTGDSVGYSFGKHVGPRLFTRSEGWLFRQSHVDQAKEFYARHGAKTIILARFVPIVRTFAPILAGIGSMPYSTFLTYNIIGGVIWAIGIPFLGYWLGQLIPDIDHYLIPIIAVILISSVVPPLWEYWKQRRKKKQ